MNLRALALEWSLDGPVGTAFLVLVAAIGVLYLEAAARGRRLDRRGRRWPWRRTACFLGGLAVLVIDLYSGIGTGADTRLSVHMLEHMVMWVIVAPLLVAGAPVRLALFALPRAGRRRLGRWLRSRAVAAVTSPGGSVVLFSAVLLVTHLPAVYGSALSNDYVHEGEHALYLLTAVLVWAPLLGVDPLPHRPGPRGQFACMVACMVPMGLIALWLGVAAGPVYGHYLSSLGPAALHDQREAATIMWVGCVAAFAVPAIRLIPIPQRTGAPKIRSHRVAA
ncbi:MAG TPA: cytochrome c oxidase assembly protein [Solirubrobacteraceae bacterium]|nr:cytochrome c oxidase assembly protein [Solirubrobacteraceae bacterium]